MPSRVEYSEEFNRNVDSVLEVIYQQIYFQTLDDDDKVHLGELLDPYTQSMLGEHAVPFADAIHSIDHARLWTGQFGTLAIWPVEGDGNVRFYPSILEDGCTYGAKVGEECEGQSRVYGRTEHDTILLAGVQVLRDQARAILNPVTGNCN